MHTRWQPEPAETASADPAEKADLQACRALLSNGSRTFLAASLLLPRSVREPACALYAFCREADDAVDQGGSACQGVQQVRERLALIYESRPLPRAADRALAFVVRRYAIPRALLSALIEGFEWDAEGRRYETIEGLQAYAARVAGTVGAMMSLLMGVRSAAALARACDLGVAMQLSNIARDVGEDARLGRLYLPLQWLREAGMDDANDFLAQPRFTPALAAVVARVLSAADELYARVDAGVAQLPLACRPGINAARVLYAEIGHEVRRRGFDSISQRAVVTPSRKLMLLVPALLTCFPSAAGASEPALPATQFLVDAVLQSPSPRTVSPTDSAESTDTTPPWALGQRFVRVIDLFERLERRERLGT